MSPPINLLLNNNNPSLIETEAISKLKQKRISLNNLNEIIKLNESRLSLDDNFVLSSTTNETLKTNKSIKTLNEFNNNNNNSLVNDMIEGLGSLSSNDSNTDYDLSVKLDSLERSTSRADTGIGSDLLSNISTSPLPHSNNLCSEATSKTDSERNNSISTSDDLSDIDDLNTNSTAIKFKNINDSTVLFPNNLLSDLEDDENINRRDTIIFTSNTCDDDKTTEQNETENKKCLNLPNNLSSCDVASLSSVYSNYSQFDFINSSNRINETETKLNSSKQQQQQQHQSHQQESNNSLSSFLGLFGSKKQLQCSNTPNKFDLITSKFFNFNKNNSSVSSKTQNSDEDKSKKFYTSSSSNSIQDNYNQILNPDLKVPDSVLIFENRPSNLPAKSQEEQLKHLKEYEKMVEAAKKKELKEKEIKIKKYQQQIRKEDFMANSLKIWNNEIIPNWHEQNSNKRTRQLWWHGLPPSIRGKVWKLAIGNELNLTTESYYFYEKKAKQKLELLSKYESKVENESSVELIKLDVSRTFPQLCFFQKDGPYHEALHNVLGAYACYNSKIGYVQGMSFLTAILLLNMESVDAFICLANLLNTKILLACFRMDQTKMNRYFRVHQILFEYNLPRLYVHFEEQNVKPDLYLIEWIFTLFSKSLPLDVMSRVWDVFFRDKEEFLFRTALGILNLYKDVLLEMDFIHIVQFLTKLPDNINSTQLFKSIEHINMCIDDITFENLVSYNN